MSGAGVASGTAGRRRKRGLRRKARTDAHNAGADQDCGVFLVLAGGDTGESCDMMRRAARDPAFDFVVLDELNSALRHGNVALSELIEAIRTRPAHQHVVITRRSARPSN
jgi:hypothetical protein